MERKIRRALVSVSDKTGLDKLGKFFHEFGIEILSTGGSARLLRESHVPVIEVSDVTGFPEMMGGRVKTLHPKIHGGILANRSNKEHQAAMMDNGIQPVDLVIVNLYPFHNAVESGQDFKTCIENIDIGGPTLIRAAAKNHEFVTVVIDPSDYDSLKSEMRALDGAVSQEFRLKNAAKAFGYTADYDFSISRWFNKQLGESGQQKLFIEGRLRRTLRYGENPHQKAYFYSASEKRPGVSSAKQLQGKQLSYNNLNDTDSAFELVSEFSDRPGCVIVKHANPSGAAIGKNLLEAYELAFDCDQESAFGGIIAFNQTVDAPTATKALEVFSEVIIAPNFDSRALEILRKKPDLRILSTGTLPKIDQPGQSIKSISGGFLVQERDTKVFDDLRVVSKRHPSESEVSDLKFAFIVAKHTKSNAIVYVKNLATVGIGAGQMSRVNASRIAAWKAMDAAKKNGHQISRAVNSVVASDAFFPFPDGLLAAAEAGVTAVIQPGGSVKDEEVIAAADESGLAMVFTGMRHFRH